MEERCFFLLNGLSLVYRKADMMQVTKRMAKSTQRVAEKPSVVMQIMPSSGLAGNTIGGSVELLESSREKVKSPVETTRMILLTPTSSSSSGTSRRCLLTRLSSLGRVPPWRYTSIGRDWAGGGP